MPRIASWLIPVGAGLILLAMIAVGAVIILAPVSTTSEEATFRTLYLTAWVASLAMLVFCALLISREPLLEGRKGVWLILLVVFGPITQFAYWYKYILRRDRPAR